MIIHQHPDLDAVTCVALTGGYPYAVHMIPAGAQEIPSVCPCHGAPLDPGERVLDHPLGEKGRLDPDGTRHAAACSMPEAAEADPDLLAEVDEQDSTGRVLHPRFPLARVLAALREEGRQRGLRGRDLDYYVLDYGSRLIRGLNLLYAQRRDAKQRAHEIETIEIGSYRLAILHGDGSPDLGIELASRGICGCIYVEGGNLGVARYPGYSQPDLRRLAPRLPGWFVHSAGFLACWGSRKNPAKAPPPKGTPQTADELARLVREVFA